MTSTRDGSGDAWTNTHPPMFKRELCAANQFPSSSSKGHVDVGMVNLGNSCFLNATLQLLFHTPSFSQWIDSDGVNHQACCVQKICITCDVGELRQQMLSSPHNPVAPEKLVSHLSEISSDLQPRRQEDAHEFLVGFLDRLNDEFLEKFSNENIDYCTRYTSLVPALFGGWLKTHVPCSKCGNVSCTFSPFLQLNVHANGDSVQQSLNNFFESEAVDGFCCARCKNQSSSMKHYSVHIPPKNLCIQVLRFDNFRNKIHDRLKINLQLKVAGSFQYRLIGVVNHLGESSHSGHYKAICRCPSGTFRVFDDEKVQEWITAPSLLGSSSWESNCYVLMYERVHFQDKVECRSGNNTHRPNVIVPKKVTQNKKPKLISLLRPNCLLVPDSELTQSVSIPVKPTLQGCAIAASPKQKMTWSVLDSPHHVESPSKHGVTPGTLRMTISEFPAETSHHLSPEQATLAAPLGSPPRPFKRVASMRRTSLVNINPPPSATLHSNRNDCTEICSLVQQEVRHSPVKEDGAIISGHSFEKKVPHLKIKKWKRIGPKESTSQSSNEYAVVEEDLLDIPVAMSQMVPQGPTLYDDKRILPLKIKRRRRIAPKESTSQSSNEYAVVEEELLGPPEELSEMDIPLSRYCKDMRISPLKIKRWKRMGPKESLSQSTHDYAIVKHHKNVDNFNASDQCTINVENDFTSPTTQHDAMESQVNQMEHSNNADISQEDIISDKDSLYETSDALLTLPKVSRNKPLEIQLTEDDVPGAKLKCPIIEKNIKNDLKRWLECRGIPRTGTKDKLISRVVANIKMNKSNVIDPAVDEGKWYNAKHLQQSGQGQQSTMPSSAAWDKFPSVNIPSMFNYGHIFHYLIEKESASLNIITEDELFEHEEELDNNDGHINCIQENCLECQAECTLSQEERTNVDNLKPFRRGMQFLKSCFVRKLMDCKEGCLYFVKCQVRASMRLEVFSVKVSISVNSGYITSSSCECRQSARGKCSHVSALLLYIWTHVKLNGYGAITCTSRENEWNKGSLKRDPGDVKQKVYPSFKIDILRRGSFDPAPTAYQLLRKDLKFVNDFASDLSSIDCGRWFLQVKYTEYIESDETLEITRQLTEKFIQNLKDQTALYGPSPLEIPGTLKQSQCPKWHAERSVRVTPSICKRILQLKTGTAKKNFLRQHVWGLDRLCTAAMQYGTKNEEKARQKYVQYRRQIDPTCTVVKCGLMPNADQPQLACSPDGLVYSQLETVRLLEIKCPFVLRKTDPQNFESNLTKGQLQSFCIRKTKDGRFELKPSHMYFYQVQMSMGILNIQVCDFFLWSQEGYILAEVPFDCNFWDKIKSTLIQIHRDLIVPEYFLMRTPRDLLPALLNADIQS